MPLNLLPARRKEEVKLGIICETVSIMGYISRVNILEYLGFHSSVMRSYLELKRWM